MTSVIKMHQEKGLPMLGPDEEVHWVHPVLASYVADIEEQAKLALLKHFPAKYSDPSFLIERELLDTWVDLRSCPKRLEAQAILARATYKSSNWDEGELKYSEFAGVDMEVCSSSLP